MTLSTPGRRPTLFDDLPFPDPEPAALPSLTLAVDEAIRLAIDLELRARPKEAVDLVRGLIQGGIGVKVTLAANGRPAGFRFELEGASFKGSELGDDYTLAGLTARGLECDPARLAELKEALARPAGPYRPAVAEILSWPDRIEPGPEAKRALARPGAGRKSAAERAAFREKFRAFAREENLLYWRNKNDSAMVFYHRSATPKGERAGMAFVDRGGTLDVRIALDRNIGAALRYGIFKWGSVAITGAPSFIARAEAFNCKKNS